MAQQNELDRLRAAWWALAGQSEDEGWRTIPIESSGARQLLAGRQFPGNEEAILVGFSSIHMPLAGVRFVLNGSGMTLPEVVDDIICRLGDHPETKAKFESLVIRAGFLRAFSDLYNRAVCSFRYKTLVG